MKTKNIFSILLFLTTLSSYCQKITEINATKKFNQYAYIDAIETYKRLAEKGYKSVDMFQKLGDSYYFNGDLESAAKWYDALFLMQSDLPIEYLYRYSQSLKSSNKYEKADQYMLEFSKKAKNDSRATVFEENRDYLAEIKANSNRYQIQNAEINSRFSDYGSTVLNTELIFTSARDTSNFFRKKDKWNNQSFTNLYRAKIINDTILEPSGKLTKNINSKLHEATAVFSKNGKKMYFTRNNFINGKKGVDDNNVILLKIYTSEFYNNEWQNPIELPFNSDSYSVAHPALSPDEKWLYFASDMPGSLGQSDLFKVLIKSNNRYGIPENLGPTINTPGKETFPFISKKNELFFATDGRPGLGGLDLFMSKIKPDGSFSKCQNIGEPANSPDDDFAYYIDTDTNRGFLSSNRKGGKGFDDIYKILEIRKLNCEQILEAIVRDLISDKTIPNATLSLFDNQFKFIKKVQSDENGKVVFEAECGKSYFIRAEKLDYSTVEKQIYIPLESGKTVVSIKIEKKIKELKNGDDLAKAFGIKIIYFDLNKSDIRLDAAFELEKIVDAMLQNPTIKIDIRSHTDSRASTEYNDILSNHRAISTQKWLISNGISSERLSSKGYGEHQLKNRCSDGIECTEEEHQENRRSEFIIISL
jgi:outer membrane protein OmpA-like peptidoglycan-associated protein